MFRRANAVKCPMKKILDFNQTLAAAAIIAAVATPFMSAQDDKKPAETPLKERLSYSYGVTIAGQLKELGMELDKEILKKAIDDVFDGKDLEMTEEEIAAATNEARRYIMEKDVKDGEAKENLDAGNKFLEENGKKKGVVTTASGLQYEVLTKADGAKPAAPSNKVTVHYVGTLLNGEQFDSSVDRGEKASFPLDGVIGGWTEGVQLMSEGEKYKFYIPYYLAYGPAGRPGSIPPYAMLTFEIELFEAGN